MPELAEYELVETIAGLRPGHPGQRAAAGRPARPDVIVAAGHHRNGVLLAPVTAELIAELVRDRRGAGADARARSARPREVRDAV